MSGKETIAPTEDGSSSPTSPSSLDSPNRHPRLRPQEHRPSLSSSFASSSQSAPPLSASEASQQDQSSASSGTASSSSSSPATREALSQSIISNLDLESEARSRRPSHDGSAVAQQAEDEERDQEAGSSTLIEANPSNRTPLLPPLVREDSTTRRVMEDVSPSPPLMPPSSLPTNGVSEAFELREGMADTSRSASSSYTSPSDFLGPSPSQQKIAYSDDPSSSSQSESERASPVEEESAAPHDPKTTATGGEDDALPETVPTVSATGMPRFLPRRTDDPTLDGRVGTSSRKGPPPPELLPEGASPPPRRRWGRSRSSSVDEDEDSSDDESTLSSASSCPHPLFLQALLPSSQLPLARRFSILSSSLLVNLGLPFINGLFLGFGEIFARSLVAPVVLGVVERGKSLWREYYLGGGVGLGGHLTMSERSQAVRDAGSGEGTGTSGLGVRAAPR